MDAISKAETDKELPKILETEDLKSTSRSRIEPDSSLKWSNYRKWNLPANYCSYAREEKS